jgi:hypothetical protein
MKILTEDAFMSTPEDTISQNDVLNFKLVYITKSALDKLNNNAGAAMEKMRSVPSYIIFSNNSKDLRAAMHDYVDRMFDAVEKTHESK